MMVVSFTSRSVTFSVGQWSASLLSNSPILVKRQKNDFQDP